jgi:2,4-dienoyl-CoA reductase-like NADH-dependent reductase (Old Yellow Enzyme family)
VHQEGITIEIYQSNRILMSEQLNPHFQPFVFKKEITVKNRVAMAPMTTWASNDDYTVSDDEVRHYQARVKGVGNLI